MIPLSAAPPAPEEPRRARRIAERGEEERHGEQPGRDVDEEDPAPREVHDEEPAEERPERVGDAPRRGEERLHAGALRHGVEVGADGHGHRLDRAGAEPLDDAKGDQRFDRPRRAAPRGGHEKEPHADGEDRPPPVGVRELAAGEHAEVEAMRKAEKTQA